MAEADAAIVMVPAHNTNTITPHFEGANRLSKRRHEIRCITNDIRTDRGIHSASFDGVSTPPVIDVPAHFFLD